MLPAFSGDSGRPEYESSLNDQLYTWQELVPVHAIVLDDDNYLPRIKTKPPKPQLYKRSQRWREIRWVYRIMQRTGKLVQLGLDKFTIKHEVKRSHFISLFANYLKVDPFVSNPHLIDLFAGFDLNDSGRIDPRDVKCALRVVSRPKHNPLSMMDFFFDTFSFVSARREVLMRAHHIVTILLVPCVTEKEASAVYCKALPLIDFFGLRGYPPPKVVEKHQFMAAFQALPELHEELHTLYLRRLADDDRMRVLHEAAYKASVIVDEHEQQIKLQEAAKFVLSVLMPRKNAYWFDKWVNRVRHFKAKRLKMQRSDAHFRQKKLKQYVAFWAGWSKIPWRKREAANRGERAMKARNFKKWKRWHASLTKLRSINDTAEMKEFKRNCAKAEVLRARIEARDREALLTLVFAALLEFAELQVRVRLGAQIYKHMRKRQFFETWVRFYKYRLSRKNKRLDRKEERLAEEAARAEAEAEAKRLAEEEAARQAAEEEKKQKKWEAQVQATKKHYKTAGLLAKQARMRAKRKQEEEKQREILFQEAVETLRKGMEAKLRVIARQYLDSSEGKEWIKAQGVPALEKLMASREDMLDEQKRIQAGNLWLVEYDWRAVSRYVKNTETGVTYWPKDDKTQPKADRINKKRFIQVVRENYEHEQLRTIATKLEARVTEMRKAEHREWMARVIQRAYRGYRRGVMVRKAFRDLKTKHRTKEQAYKSKKRTVAAKVIYDFVVKKLKATQTRDMLADLVLQMWVCKTVPETGETIWINIATRRTQKEKPALMQSVLTGGKIAELEVPDWAFVRSAAGNYYQNSKTEEVVHEVPVGYRMCVECTEDFAVKHCKKCEDRYCDACFLRRHQKGTRRNHIWAPVHVKVVKCAWCKKQPSTLMCEECDDAGYCAPCSEHVHQLEGYEGHSLEAL